MPPCPGATGHQACRFSTCRTVGYRGVARSVDLALTSTRCRVALMVEKTFRTLVVGPMTVSSSFCYRIRSYSGPDFGTERYSSGWVSRPGKAALELEWENPWFWLGVVPSRDSERGVYLVHRLPEPTAGQYWSFEIDDQQNGAGHIDIGRLFMADCFEPDINYSYDNNGLSFRDNSLKAQTLGGTSEFWRRLDPRTFRFSLPWLSEEQGFGAAYDLMQVAGYTGEVFVLPDTDDAETLQKRSFLGTVTQMDPLAQVAFGMTGTGFQIEEII